jgi:hypothetical protein
MESIPTDSEPTDEDLLGRLSSDPAAFEVFYRRHVDRVVGFAARRVSEPADENIDEHRYHAIRVELK